MAGWFEEDEDEVEVVEVLAGRVRYNLVLTGSVAFPSSLSVSIDIGERALGCKWTWEALIAWLDVGGGCCAGGIELMATEKLKDGRKRSAGIVQSKLDGFN